MKRLEIMGRNESSPTTVELKFDNEEYERNSVYEQETNDHKVKMPTVVTARVSPTLRESVWTNQGLNWQPLLSIETECRQTKKDEDYVRRLESTYTLL